METHNSQSNIEINKPIYIYKKTHRKTGLNYLGKTEQNPYKYRGSGTVWINHIKEHGYDVETIILQKCSTYEEAKKWGLHYSNLWNIVDSVEWANLTEENASGFSSEQVKKLWNTDEYRKKIADYIAKSHEKRSQITTELWKNNTYRNNLSGRNAKSYNHTIYHFVHVNGNEEICTLNELSQKYQLFLSHVVKVTKGKRKSHGGWRLVL